ncbi:helix-turn-helix domain-containing protein [Castellaniella sp.]|uniref:AraC family transcriptional regulator n=1 Tax=Castellaniella sp. TaxID=1955812 RepID=UPI00356095E5
MMMPVQSDDLHLRLPPFGHELQELPAPFFFRVEDMPSHATYPALRHPWGEFIYSFSGITEVRIRTTRLLAPPHSGLWIPPETEHTCFNHREAAHCSLYIRSDLCTALPGAACALLISPLVRAILGHLYAHRSDGRPQPGFERLLWVLVEQLSSCEAAASFIPDSDDPRLGPLLQALRDDPADNRSIAQLAGAFHMSERTLMRRCRTDLGMSLTEWRQRLRLARALALISSGRSVESVALDLGYATSSAFIAMFRRRMGASPKGYITGQQ